MLDVPSEANDAQIFIFNDNETPWPFVINLLRSVFGKSEADAVALAAATDKHGRSAVGTYPPEVARALLGVAQDRIRAEGYPLALGSEPVSGTGSIGLDHCGLCGKTEKADHALIRGKALSICQECLLAWTSGLSDALRSRQFKYAYEALAWHFAGTPQDQLVTTSRQFPGHMRADVQRAIDKLFSVSPIRFFGIFEQYRYETLTYAALARDGQQAAAIAPAQYQDVDIGEEAPVKCLNNGLWLCCSADLRYAASFYPRIANTAMKRGHALRSQCPSAKWGASLPSAASPSSKERSTPRDLIAARFYRLRVVATIKGGQRESDRIPAAARQPS